MAAPGWKAGLLCELLLSGGTPPGEEVQRSWPKERPTAPASTPWPIQFIIYSDDALCNWRCGELVGGAFFISHPLRAPRGPAFSCLPLAEQDSLISFSIIDWMTFS